MKTSRLFRIFMMVLDSFILFFLRFFRKFTKLEFFGQQLISQDTPYATKNSNPENLGIETELNLDGQAVESYERSERIYFSNSTYTPHEGIVTFRGDNYRTGAAFGTARMRRGGFGKVWNIDTSKLKKGYGSGYWTGSGWTGQPLVVRWTRQELNVMNIYEEKKQKEELVEVIYSTMDGNVYFLDLEDGTRTRDDLKVGLPFKGAGALHPTLPMLFLGAGDSGANEGEYARGYIYSLIDQQKLMEFGGEDPFSLRKFHGYDSSPLVDVNTDTFIEPGENGIIYTFKLGTCYDANTGELSINPSEKLKLRYKSNRSSEERYWLGMEDSAVIWKEYLYIADNGGNLMCFNINTMELIWAQDVVDDTNGSPVLSLEGGVPYLYIATSLHWIAGAKLKLGDVPIFKINAINGEYVWKRTYLCNTVAGVSGGIQATCALGTGEVDNLVYFPVARTPSVRGGILVALDKTTGKEVWRFKLKRYAWSSPVLIHDASGRVRLIQGDSVGNLYMLDALTGKLLDKTCMGSNIEASPVVFENTLVVGTRGQKIYGVKLV